MNISLSDSFVTNREGANFKASYFSQKYLILATMVAFFLSLSPVSWADEVLPKKNVISHKIDTLIDQIRRAGSFQPRWFLVSNFDDMFRYEGVVPDDITDRQIDSLFDLINSEHETIFRLLIFELFERIGSRTQRLIPGLIKIYNEELCDIPPYENDNTEMYFQGSLSTNLPREMRHIIERISGLPLKSPACNSKNDVK